MTLALRNLLDNALKFGKSNKPIEIKVSKGTYIRTLLEDFAKALGTVGHMSALHRTQTGVFSGAHMLTLEQIAELDKPLSCLLPMQKALIEYPRLDLTAGQTQDLIHGKQVERSEVDDTYCMMDHHDIFMGLGLLESNRLRVKNIFMKSYQQLLKQQGLPADQN